MRRHSRVWGHLLSILTIIIALVAFFPILWMVLTSFKSEADAFTYPPPLIFHPTLDQYDVALGASGYFKYLLNTVIVTGFSTLAALLLGVPAAYALAYYPTRRSNFTLSWVMSTRMLPAVGVIVPLYIIFKNLGWFDTYHGLVLLYTGVNLPLVICVCQSLLFCDF